jgi:hypothetical protein
MLFLGLYVKIIIDSFILNSYAISTNDPILEREFNNIKFKCIVSGGIKVEWVKEEYLVSDDKSIIDLNAVYSLISTSDLASNRTKDSIAKSVINSLSFGVYHNGVQIGFARVVTDKTVFSWVSDVVVEKTYFHNGIDQWLMECILDHPEIKNTEFVLATTDARISYRKSDSEDNKSMTSTVTN